MAKSTAKAKGAPKAPAVGLDELRDLGERVEREKEDHPNPRLAAAVDALTRAEVELVLYEREVAG